MSRIGPTIFGRSGPSASSVGWATWALVGLVIVPFLVGFFTSGSLYDLLRLVPGEVLSKPWTLVTYPLADPGQGGAFLFTVLAAYWAYVVGSSVEKDLGSSLLAAWTGALILIGGLALFLGGFAGAGSRQFSGSWLTISAITIMWASRNPNSTVMMMMIIPVQAKWIGVLTAGAVLFGYGTGSPLVGVLALIPLALAFAYALNRLPGLRYGATPADMRSKKRKDENFNSFMDEVRKREKEREERERLRRLFESSLKDDPDEGDSSRKGRP